MYTKEQIYAELGISADSQGCFDGKEWGASSGKKYECSTPADGSKIGTVELATTADYDRAMKNLDEAQSKWALTPAPKRGQIVKAIGEALKAKIEPLGALISLEMGKIFAEGVGEIQEIVDICEFAVGLSRSLNGRIIPSERQDHVILENWNPIGKVGVVTAFNFPTAVLGWNLALALVCGDVCVWKCATSTSMVAVGLTKVIVDAIKEAGGNTAVFATVAGPGATLGEHIIQDANLDLVSFTGSSAVGQRVSEVVHGRFGKTILELGGNNAVVVMDDANIKQAVSSVFFGAVGTAGQRCTSTRRVLIHESVYDEFKTQLLAAYDTKVKIGHPLDETTLMGPLHNQAAVDTFTNGLVTIAEQGGKIIHGGKRLEQPGFYVTPAVVESNKGMAILLEELFVPIVHLVKISSIEEAIEVNNSVPQGLSSALFTESQKNIFKWTGPSGSDCGLVNVNIGTSGAEIGGAFGGLKEGNGTESGSDSWRQYMKRQTSTIFYGAGAAELSQGISFD